MDYLYNELRIRIADADATLMHGVTLTAGRVGLHCEFDFADNKWNGLGKVAVVRSGNSETVVTIVNNTITIPSNKLIAGNNLIVGVYGTNGSTIVIPTIWCACGTVYNATDVSASDNVQEVTKSFADQVMFYMNEALMGKITGVTLHAENIGFVGTPQMTMHLIDGPSSRTYNFTGDGVNASFQLGQDVGYIDSVKVNGATKTIATDYLFNASGHYVIFNTVPASGASIVIVGKTYGRTLDVTAANFKGNGISSINFNPTTNLLSITEQNGTVTEFDALATAITTLQQYEEGVEEAEAIRVSNESSRTSYEQFRQQAEDARVEAEEARAEAEESRDEAESSRVSAESARASAESSRSSAESSRVSAETARGTAETARQSQETSRVSAETARASAETTRQSQETSRVNAESGRVSAESSRVGAESARVAAESSRVSAESARVTAESERVNTESSRNSAETARASAESSRASAETVRDSAETQRESNEASRQSAESGRVTAESARVTAEEGRVTAEEERVTEFATFESRIETLEEDVSAHSQQIDALKSSDMQYALIHMGLYRDADGDLCEL